MNLNYNPWKINFLSSSSSSLSLSLSSCKQWALLGPRGKQMVFSFSLKCMSVLRLQGFVCVCLLFACVLMVAIIIGAEFCRVQNKW